MYKNHKVIVIAPCYNEELKISEVVERINSMREHVVDEVLVVDDGSTDSSARVSKDKGASVISMGRVAGVGAAIRAGFRFALEKKYDLIVVIAGNNKDEPNEIPDLLKPIVHEGYDFVQGSRYLKHNATLTTSQNMANMPWYRKVATRLHPFLFSLLSGKKVTESTNGFRAIRASVLKDDLIRLEQAWLDQYELEPYLYFKVVRLGYKTTEVPCTKVYPAKDFAKKHGYTKMKPFVSWWSILRPLILLRLGLKF
ncbi:MAG: glycosyltransferase family 2 protein [Bdellovibrio sp.]|nr:glycosyltransferase family 2 protein [Bdellovibrio sp.]